MFKWQWLSQWISLKAPMIFRLSEASGCGAKTTGAHSLLKRRFEERESLEIQ